VRIEHAFKRPNGNALQSADFDYRDFSASCGVVRGVAAETEIKPSGLRDGNRQRSVLVSHHNPQIGWLRRSFQGDEDKTTLIAEAIIDTYPDIANRIEEIFVEARRDDFLADSYKEDLREREATERAAREGNDE
jgi:hypothetical protein